MRINQEIIKGKSKIWWSLFILMFGFLYSFGQVSIDFEPITGQLSVSTPTYDKTLILDGDGGFLNPSFGSLNLKYDTNVGVLLWSKFNGGDLSLFNPINNKKNAGLTADGDINNSLGKDYGHLFLRGDSEIEMFTGPFLPSIEFWNIAEEYLEINGWKIGFRGDNIELFISQTLLVMHYVENLSSPSIEVAHINKNGAYHQISDSRLKRRIQSLPDILPRLMRIRPSTYQIGGNIESDKKQFGFIAQNLLVLFPQLISEINEGTKSFLNINYAGMIPVLIKAMQEQHEIVLEQNMLLDQLLRRMSVLERDTR